MSKPKAHPATNEGGNAKARKACASPRLVTYGNVAEITRAVGNKGNDDAGTGMTDKTAA